MNEYDLFDAFGGIDDELLERSERRVVRRLSIRKALIAAAAVLAAWYIAVHPIKAALAADAMLPLPTDGQCALTLAIWAALELFAILAMLLVLSGRNERRGLLRLIRR